MWQYLKHSCFHAFADETVITRIGMPSAMLRALIGLEHGDAKRKSDKGDDTRANVLTGQFRTVK